MLWLSLFTTALLSLNGCVSVTVQDVTVCSVAGKLMAGAICATTISGKKTEMPLGTLIDMLEPQQERPDPSNAGKTLPQRGGALIMSADDWGKMKNTIEVMCREMGSSCDYEKVKAFVESIH